MIESELWLETVVSSAPCADTRRYLHDSEAMADRPR